ncbi:hypothetical protein AGIG_G17114 [Arapaima gigas]
MVFFHKKLGVVLHAIFVNSSGDCGQKARKPKDGGNCSSFLQRRRGRTLAQAHIRTAPGRVVPQREERTPVRKG